MVELSSLRVTAQPPRPEPPPKRKLYGSRGLSPTGRPTVKPGSYSRTGRSPALGPNSWEAFFELAFLGGFMRSIRQADQVHVNLIEMVSAVITGREGWIEDEASFTNEPPSDSHLQSFAGRCLDKNR